MFLQTSVDLIALVWLFHKKLIQEPFLCQNSDQCDRKNQFVNSRFRRSIYIFVTYFLIAQVIEKKSAFTDWLEGLKN